MPRARADLETLLRSRHLDRTLTTSLPAPEPDPEYACRPPGVPVLDARLGGGFPRGQLSEIVGARSSGCCSLLVSMMAAAMAQGELVALVDALDMLDVGSAAGAGVDLERLLWIRGHVVSNPGLCRDMNQRALEQAIRALGLVLQAGNFGLVAFDAGEAPAGALKRLPFTTWLRLQRMIEGTQTVCVLVGPEPMARSSAGLTVQLGQAGRSRRSSLDDLASGGGGPQRQWKKVDSARFSDRLFKGLDTDVRVVRARARGVDDVRVPVSTVAC
jgi:recA bacterial DNA recombination protein